MKKTHNEVQIQVRFSHDVWSEIKRLAEDHERSFNGEVMWALRHYIQWQKGGIGEQEAKGAREHDPGSPLSDA
jgi:hypothetical protein